MLVAEHTIRTKADAETIWDKWSDVASWHEWCKDVEFCEIDGPFERETTGIIKPLGSPATAFMIIGITPFKEFIDISNLPFSKLVSSHHIRKLKKNIAVTQRIELEGPLAFLYAIFMGRKLRQNLADSLNKFREIVEND